MRALPAGLLMLLALTSCTGSPAPDSPAAAHRSTEAVSPPAQDQVVESLTAPVSLPCAQGPVERLVGARHNIVGGVFAPRLVSPPSQDYANKILWTSDKAAGSADLLISATLNRSIRHVERRVRGDVTPGPSRPSIINVPEAGCWTFSLRWGDTRDLVAVLYGRSV